MDVELNWSTERLVMVGETSFRFTGGTGREGRSGWFMRMVLVRPGESILQRSQLSSVWDANERYQASIGIAIDAADLAEEYLSNAATKAKL